MKKIFIGLLSLALLVWLMVAGTASAAPVTIPLSDFVIFSGGTLTIDAGLETSIGGHVLINGNIGSNQDLFMQGNPLPGYPAQLNGSAYAGGKLTFGQDLTVGSSTMPREVVANGAANIGGGATIWGTLDALSATLGSGASVTGGVTAPSSKTFSLITMPAATVFTAGGANQTVPTGQGNSLTLAPGTYGTLATSSQNQSVVLSSGNYYFDAISTQGGFDLQIDLTSGNCINIYVVGNADFAGQQTLLVKGAGTGGSYLPISDPNAQALASLIYLETHARFTMTGGLDGTHNIWGGTVYASLLTGGSPQVVIGQYTDWYGAAFARDSFDTADHGKWTNVPLTPCTTTTTVPPTTTTTVEPTTTTTVPTTAIELSKFKAISANRKVILIWETETETDNAGFNILRADAEDGEYTQINESIIPAIGSSVEGADYHFFDTTVKNRQTYYYKLEDVDLNEVATLHGPVHATPRLIFGRGRLK